MKYPAVLTAVLLCLSFNCGSKTSTSTTTTDASAVSLTLDWRPEPEFGGFYAALNDGTFKQRGLTVQIETAGPGAPTWQLVASDKADFATTAADQVVLARSQGADVVAVFAVYQTSPQGVMVHKARGFKFLSDVFSHPGTLEAEDATWLSFCRQKFGPGPVKVTSYSDGIATFLAQPNHSQQCFITSEPLQAKAKGSDPQTFLIAHAGYNPYTTVVITSGNTLRNKPDVVKKMVTACRLGWRTYLDNPGPTNTTMGLLNKDMDAATFSAAAAAQKELIETPETTTAGVGSMTASRWETLSRQLLELKKIPKPVPAADCFADIK